MCVAETWLNNDIQDNLVIDNEHVIFRKDRDGRGGGVCIISKQGLNACKVRNVDEYQDLEIIAVDFMMNARKFRIVCIYIPLQFAKVYNYMEKVIGCIGFMREKCKEIYITGDFNLPGIGWNEHMKPRCKGTIENYFVQKMGELGLVQFINKPNRGKHFLILVFGEVNEGEIDCDLFVPFCESDSPPHLPVEFNIQLETRTEDPYMRKDYERSNYNEIMEVMYKYSRDIRKIEGRGFKIEDYESMLVDCDKKIVSKKVRTDGKRKDGFTKKCAKIKLRAWREYQRNGTEENMEIYKNIEKAYKENVKYQREKRLNEICDQENMNAFYSEVRSKRKGNRNIPAIRDDKGNMVMDDGEKAKLFLKNFSRAYVIDEGVGRKEIAENSSIEEENDCFKDCFDKGKIRGIINKWKAKSAPGPDGIPPIFYKKTIEMIPEILSEVFTDCLERSMVPEEWKSAMVIPVYKGKGDRSMTGSYRPISLTNVVSKIMEKCMGSCILQFAIHRGVIPREQYGFVPGRTSVIQMLQCWNDWTDYMERGIPFDVFFADFEKAFDRVKRSLLMKKLRDIGMPEKWVRLIEELFSGRKHKIKVGRSISEEDEVTSGVVQGTVLGAILFIIYTGGIARTLSPYDSAIFADDVKWYAPVDSLEKGYDLWEVGKKFLRWCEHNQLFVSKDKTMVLQLGSKNMGFKYEMNGWEIDAMTENKDLGIVINDELDLTHYYSEIALKATRVSFMIRKCFGECGNRTLERAYRIFIRPILEYNTQVWSPYKIKDIELIERTQRKYTKYMHGLHDLSYEQRLKVLGWKSLEWRRIELDLKLGFKIVNNRVHQNEHNRVLEISESRTNREGIRLKVGLARRNTRYNFFSNRVARIWNDLPHMVTSEQNYRAFCKKIGKHDFSKYLKCFKF